MFPMVSGGSEKALSLGYEAQRCQVKGLCDTRRLILDLQGLLAFFGKPISRAEAVAFIVSFLFPDSGYAAYGGDKKRGAIANTTLTIAISSHEQFLI